MTDRFTIEIDLGNEGMEAPSDVAQALRKIATRLDDATDMPLAQHPGIGGNVMDTNGNTVGSWFVSTVR
jgi:hypothetical protein